MDLFGPERAPGRILDLGTGSGALLLAALAEWPEASGLGVDMSAAALAVAPVEPGAISVSGDNQIHGGDDSR